MSGGIWPALFLMRISDAFTSAKTNKVRRDVASASSLSGAISPRTNTTAVVAATGVRVHLLTSPKRRADFLAALVRRGRATT
jgi:hypothetical protein